MCTRREMRNMFESSSLLLLFLWMLAVWLLLFVFDSTHFHYGSDGGGAILCMCVWKGMSLAAWRLRCGVCTLQNVVNNTESQMCCIVRSCFFSKRLSSTGRETFHLMLGIKTAIIKRQMKVARSIWKRQLSLWNFDEKKWFFQLIDCDFKISLPTSSFHILMCWLCCSHKSDDDTSCTFSLAIEKRIWRIDMTIVAVSDY